MHNTKASLFVKNAQIWNGRKDFSGDSLAVFNDKIIGIGKYSDISDLIDSSTNVIDAQNRRVIPGLIDSHIHSVRAGLTWNQNVDWSGVKSLQEGFGLISEKIKEKKSGEWICVVGGWAPGQFKENRLPTIEEINNIAPNNPVYIQYLYESAIFNSAASKAIGLDAKSPDPVRGWFERTSTGELSGLCKGSGAFQLCLGIAGRPDFETQVQWTAAFMRRLNSLGISGVIDPGGFGMTPESYRPIYELWRRKEMTVRTRLYRMPLGPGLERENITDFIKHMNPGFGDDWLKLIGCGEMVSFGFMDLEGVQPFEVTQDGIDLFEELLPQLINAGWSIHLHAVLEKTITTMLDSIEKVLKTTPADKVRISLAHAEPITEKDLDRVQKMGIGIAIQDRMIFRAKDSANFWGEDILRRSPPLRSMLNRGIVVGGGTDATAVTPYNPWRSLWWLITGETLDSGPSRDKNQNLTREEALISYTQGSAWFSLDEDSRGTLEIGKLADFAVLSDDYFEVEESQIPEIRSLMTVVNGEIVYEGDK